MLYAVDSQITLLPMQWKVMNFRCILHLMVMNFCCIMQRTVKNLFCVKLPAALCSGKSNHSSALCMMVDTEIHNIVETPFILQESNWVIRQLGYQHILHICVQGNKYYNTECLQRKNKSTELHFFCMKTVSTLLQVKNIYNSYEIVTALLQFY